MPPLPRPRPDDAVDPARRAVATGALVSTALVAGGGLLGGCGTSGGPRSGAVPGAPGAPGIPRGDEALLVAALRAEDERVQDLRTVRRRQRSLRAGLSATEAVHRRHRTLLRAALPEGLASSSPESPGQQGRSAPVDLRALTRSERALSARQAGLAMSADSGALARLLAGLSAAAAQQAEVLAGLAPSGAGTT